MSFKSWSAEQTAQAGKKVKTDPKVSTLIGPTIEQPTVPADEMPGVSKPKPKP
jgi:hypothetical protein